MDADLAGIYAEHEQLSGLQTRFAFPLIRLAHQGPMTIRDLAESLGRTHSAVSQTVSALRDQGLVETNPGPDARTRIIELTDHARDLIPLLEAEWRATEEAIAALDAELSVHLADYVEEMTTKLEERDFKSRVLDQLDWSSIESGDRSGDPPARAG